MGDTDERAVYSPDQQQAAARDAAHWAKTVSRLTVTDVPAGAVKPQRVRQAARQPDPGLREDVAEDLPGALPRERVSAVELIATWKQHFPEFWPLGNHFYAPLTGIAPGDVALLNLGLPGKMTLSTGVMVLYADEESFTLMTPQGHMFAGWITFSATETDDETLAQAQVLMRASDPIFELGLTLGGHHQEDKFWGQTLQAVAAHFGVAADVDTQVVCVDKKRQWSRWTNVWHSAAIRSTVYWLAAPLRVVAHAVDRGRAAR
jgi:hypothetical protein